jgi:hypothetical protein
MSEKNIDRLAVIIAGEFRTWKVASKYLFSFFQERAVQVDYYFATWNVSETLQAYNVSEKSPVTDKDILEIFKDYNQNLVSYKIMDRIGNHATTFYNQAWLSKIGNILKRKNEIENNIIYDQVVETRPDLYFRKNDKNWIIFNDLECSNNHFYLDSGLQGVNDVYFRSNSITNDILADRYYFKIPYMNECIHWQFVNHHSVLSDIFYNRKILVNKTEYNREYDFNVCIRPNTPTNENLDEAEYEYLDQFVIEYSSHKKFRTIHSANEPRVDIDE